MISVFTVHRPFKKGEFLSFKWADAFFLYKYKDENALALISRRVSFISN